MKKILKSKGKNILAAISGAIAIRKGFRQYRRDAEISTDVWMKLLVAHYTSNGRFTRRLESLLRVVRPPEPISEKTGLLGTFSIKEQMEIAATIARDGYYIFPKLLPDHICAGIEAFAECTPAMIDGEMNARDEMLVYDRAAPKGRLYKIREQDSTRCDAVQALMADQALLGIAEAYLGTATTVGGVDMWWSAPYGNGPSDTAAQLFHFDFDAPPRWLKLFIYVNDVGPEQGPHVFVEGSHHNELASAREIRARGYVRIPDGDIAATFGKNVIKEFTGPRGTVFFADTRAFHKGKHPQTGDRLLTQLIYCSAVFNKHAPKPPRLDHLSVPLSNAIDERPDAYVRYRA